MLNVFILYADLIAQGLSPFSPSQVAIKSGKLVLEQIKEFSKNGLDFGLGFKL